MSHPIIQIHNLSHRYSRNWAIRDINIEITKPGIYGLLGSNGAGKSTTMNILCGVLKPTSGAVSIAGVDLLKEPVEAKKHLGFLPQQAPLYLDFTVREYLTYCAQLRLMPKADIPNALDEVLEKTGIKHFSERLLRNLSGGYRQRAGLAQAIIHRPDIVVLDEPTNGLDPNQIVEVRKLIREIAEGRVVLISSHILSEIQLLSDEILMIENGQLVFADSMDAFNNYVAPSSLSVLLEKAPSIDALTMVAGITRVEELGNKRYRLYFEGDEDVSSRVIAASVQGGWELREITVEKQSVDEVFRQLTQKAKGG